MEFNGYFLKKVNNSTFNCKKIRQPNKFHAYIVEIKKHFRLLKLLNYPTKYKENQLLKIQKEAGEGEKMVKA